MDLLDLEPLVGHLGVEPSPAELSAIFTAFRRDFIEHDLFIDGLKVKVVLKDARVEGFEAYPETFVHLITRKSSSGNRVFDPRRANKIHWIRPILENKDADDVKYFEYTEGDGSIRDYYWFEEGQFIVIMKKISPNYMIVTSFNVDPENEKYYRDRHNAFKRRFL
jgi:hypothetical protein